jgi:alkylation response protein AidB-like acyl-CoA dehydrogenase
MKTTVLGEGVKLLNKVAGAEFIEKLGLRETTNQVIHDGAVVGFKVAQEAIKVAAPLARLAKPARLEGKSAPRHFDLRLTEEQEMVRDSVQRFAQDVLRPASAEADEACLAPAEILQQAHEELGLFFMAVPEDLGGAGVERSPVSTALVLEDLSYGDMGLAAAIAAPLGVIAALTDFGTAEQQAQWLARFAGESFVPAALAVLEARPLFDPYKLKCRALPKDGGYTLYGKKSLVPLAATAEFFLIAADLMGAGPQLFIVPSDAKGLTIAAQPSMGLRSAGMGTLELDAVHLPFDALLGEKKTGFKYGAVVDRSRIGWGALSVGTGRAVLDYVKTYCNERTAFGQPITNRQSVAFLIADIALELEGVRLVVWRAASRAEFGKSFEREAALARILSAKKGMKIGTDGVQLLGGHGFVKDHPVELWYRHLRAIGLSEGVAYV